MLAVAAIVLSSPLLAAMAHAQFEAIHPFGDGNGRLGRTLVHHVLRRRGLAPRMVPPVSMALAARSSTYVRGLNAFATGGLTSWLDTFGRALKGAAERAAVPATCIAELQPAWRRRAGNPRRDSGAEAITACLPAASWAQFHADLVQRKTPCKWTCLQGAKLVTRTGIESNFSPVNSSRYGSRESDGNGSTEPSDASGRVETSLQASEVPSASPPLPGAEPELFLAAGAVVAEWAARRQETRSRVEEILRRAVDQATVLREGAP